MANYVLSKTGQEIEDLLNKAGKIDNIMQDISTIKEKVLALETDTSSISDDVRVINAETEKINTNVEALDQELNTVKEDTEVIGSNVQALQALGLYIKDGVVYDVWQE